MVVASGRATFRVTKDHKPKPLSAMTIPSPVLTNAARTWMIAASLNSMFRLRRARWQVPRPLKIIERAIPMAILFS